MGTDPITFPLIWYKLNVFTAAPICSSWSGRSPSASDNTDILLKNDGINNKMKGIVTANAFELVFADTNMDKNRINKLPIYPPQIFNK